MQRQQNKSLMWIFCETLYFNIAFLFLLLLTQISITVTPCIPSPSIGYVSCSQVKEKWSGKLTDLCHITVMWTPYCRDNQRAESKSESFEWLIEIPSYLHLWSQTLGSELKNETTKSLLLYLSRILSRMFPLWGMCSGHIHPGQDPGPDLGQAEEIISFKRPGNARVAPKESGGGGWQEGGGLTYAPSTQQAATFLFCFM